MVLNTAMFWFFGTVILTFCLIKPMLREPGGWFLFLFFFFSLLLVVLIHVIIALQRSFFFFILLNERSSYFQLWATHYIWKTVCSNLRSYIMPSQSRKVCFCQMLRTALFRFQRLKWFEGRLWYLSGCSISSYSYSYMDATFRGPTLMSRSLLALNSSLVSHESQLF